MSTSQRARSGVPLDHRSILATLPGVPAWGAVAIAAGLTFLGFLIDAARGTELTGAFAFFYILGCIAAVVLVRYRGLFTAMVQAPLILFVAVPLSYQYFTDNAGTSLKDIILNVAIPLVNRFPLMLLGTVVAVGLGALRIVLKRQNTHAPTLRRSQKAEGTVRRRSKSESAVRRTPKPSDDKPTRAQRRAQEERPERTRRRATPSVDRSTDAAAEATDIVPGPYVGRRGTDPRSNPAPRTSRVVDPSASPRRSSGAVPAPPNRHSGADSPRQDHARSEHQKPDYQRPQYPQAQQPQARQSPRPQSGEPRYSTEPRRQRSTQVQSPREVPGSYATGSRPVVTPQTTSSSQTTSSTDANQAPGNHSLPGAHRDDIPPHPVPQVRYRDRHTD
ncbi:DUF6542 domain-containing protein [Rhodococcoides yunnanense]|uniref:DUF6542 domain-containing protein n=1 Tax=Rhodococcoides yunnanense TaxID=278209 RepID=A0ABU4BIJ6_9NOCA|nr:DUF6542 domain-containing protein [Rhodococcus yunnanensis]MDV6264032.1 DUF6542 domain-containing protein [Rhodococcus yunnanensis]